MSNKMTEVLLFVKKASIPNGIKTLLLTKINYYDNFLEARRSSPEKVAEIGYICIKLPEYGYDENVGTVTRVSKSSRSHKKQIGSRNHQRKIK